jgi:branched-chain amino acid aminotransferase
MININGIILATEDASIPVFNRGFQYGDALFETIRVINNDIMFWEDHYFRLMSSMRILRMEIPANFSPEFLATEIQNTIEANGLLTSPAKVKINVWRKEGGLYTPKNKAIAYMISVFPLAYSFYQTKTDPYEVELFKDYFVASGLLTSIKTNNRIVSVLAGVYATDNEYQNCLLLNEQKSVVEAANGNLFLVNGNTIKTPPIADGCLNGITRKQVIAILKDLNDYEIEEASISPFELQKADELFITNVITGIQPITKYRKKEYATSLATRMLGLLNAKARLG